MSDLIVIQLGDRYVKWFQRGGLFSKPRVGFTSDLAEAKTFGGGLHGTFGGEWVSAKAANCHDFIRKSSCPCCLDKPRFVPLRVEACPKDAFTW